MSVQAGSNSRVIEGEHTCEQLADPAARAATSKELGERISKRCHGDVVDVYFTEFVMQ